MSMSDGGMMGQDGDMPMMRMMQRMSRMMDGCEKMMSGMSGEQDRERPGDPSRQAPRAPEKKS